MKMKHLIKNKIVIILCLNFFLVHWVIAQDIIKGDPRLQYEEDFIYLNIDNNEYKYYKNGKMLKTGLFFRKLKKEFQSYPEALAVYKKSRKYIIGSYWASIFGGAATDIIVDKHVPSEYNINPISMTSGLGTVALIQEVGETKSQYYLRKAVFMRNQIIKQKQEQKKLFKHNIN